MRLWASCQSTKKRKIIKFGLSVGLEMTLVDSWPTVANFYRRTNCGFTCVYRLHVVCWWFAKKNVSNAIGIHHQQKLYNGLKYPLKVGLTVLCSQFGVSFLFCTPAAAVWSASLRTTSFASPQKLEIITVALYVTPQRYLTCTYSSSFKCSTSSDTFFFSLQNAVPNQCNWILLHFLVNWYPN